MQTQKYCKHRHRNVEKQMHALVAARHKYGNVDREKCWINLDTGRQIWMQNYANIRRDMQTYTEICKHKYIDMQTYKEICKHKFIHSDYFYSASSSPQLLRGAPNTARILCWNFTPKRHRQLWVKDLPKVPTWRLEWESNPWPFRRKASTLPKHYHAPSINI